MHALNKRIRCRDSRNACANNVRLDRSLVDDDDNNDNVDDGDDDNDDERKYIYIVCAQITCLPCLLAAPIEHYSVARLRVVKKQRHSTYYSKS